MSEPKKELEFLPKGTQASECFLVREDSVFLGLKKRKLFKGKLMGPGGKIKEGESMDECAKREVLEEFDVKVKSMKKAGFINFFYYESGRSTSQQVDFYLIDGWEGEPKETEEMKPVGWYKFDEIPLDQMPAQNKLFIPWLLRGQFVSGNLVLDKDMNLVSNQLVFSPVDE